MIALIRVTRNQRVVRGGECFRISLFGMRTLGSEPAGEMAAFGGVSQVVPSRRRR